MDTVLAVVLGVWILAQATAGRLPARLLSFRTFSPSETPPADQPTSSPSSSSSATPVAAPTSSSSPSSAGWMWPVHGPVTQPFGAGKSAQHPQGHPGTDIGVPTGTAVRAAHAGTIRQAGWNDGYGNSVTIDAGDGVTVLTGHMSRVDVIVGRHVDAGDQLGLSGSTGYSTGPHVHVEIHRNGGLVDAAGVIGGAP